MNSPNLIIKSPCVGVCSTGISDSVCRGCKRFTHEVIAWNGYSDAERYAIMQRISQLLQQVSEPLIEIRDANQLRQALEYQNIRFDKRVGPYVWLYDLLQAGAAQVSSLEAFGCRLNLIHKGRSLVDIRTQIDQDFYTLSEVHYERYFRGRE